MFYSSKHMRVPGKPNIRRHYIGIGTGWVWACGRALGATPSRVYHLWALLEEKDKAKSP